MKLLPETFTKKSFLHQQVWREGNVAIYKRFKEGGTPHYETIIIREVSASSYSVDEVKAGQFKTRVIERERGEVYPSSEQWGYMGWTYGSYEEARARAQKLLEKAA